MTFISYAQNFEDVLLWRALKDVGEGFYIDVGAHHPDLDSVTRAFYERGWHGINVEPVAAAAALLRQARPRDLTLQLALGAAPGEADFFVVSGTGLSTLDADASRRAAAQGWEACPTSVRIETLAEICRRHTTGPVHFLKIDVEGSEAAVLAGADFAACRPWIILAEATAPLTGELTHRAWEPALLASGYRFAWFDGLNCFYVAAEHEGLLPRLAIPPNVGDDFLRADDLHWARKLERAEGQALALDRRLADLERSRRASEEAVERAYLLLAAETARRGDAEQRLADAAAREVAAMNEVADLRAAVAAGREEAAVAQAWLDAMRRSLSWRVTAPLRTAKSGVQRLRARPEAAPDPAPASAPVAARPRPPAAFPPALRTVHQFHSGSASGDAITNAMLLTRRLLRELGYRSDIFVEHRDPALADDIRLLAELPRHADYVLLLRHSIGNDAHDRVLALPAPKVLHYHNITPPEHLPPAVQPFARLGREQLRGLLGQVHAATADSHYSAAELRRLGFDPVAACPLLFDLPTPRPRPPADPGAPFTILFVGRMIESKGQLDLVDAFAAFLAGFGRPARLVLVGHHGGPPDPYCAAVLEAIRRHRLDAQVIVTGPVSDAELERWYGRADLYLSLSRHEGFGVPLVEAMARGVPVLAWPSGAVAETVGEGGRLLAADAPSAVAAELLGLARDPEARAALAERGRHALDRFRLERHLPKLLAALGRAGLAPPPDLAARGALAAALRYTVAGHVNGAYSLAAINIDLAAALDGQRPGRVRLLPVEGVPTDRLAHVAPERRAEAGRLAGRPPFSSGFEVVISQHYPVFTPALPNTLPLALFFWEESLVPRETVATLNERFAAVLAPSRAVAKALRDSGVHRPVHVLPLAPALDPFAAPAAQPQVDVVSFLHVSSGFPRKGIDLLLAAFARAFRRGDRVRLVIKTFPNPHNGAAAQLEALRAQDPELPEIRLIDAEQPASDLLALYREAHALVLPTRGEGYNLPAAEAMAAGLPLIATGFGGQLDFCGPDEARLLRWRFAPSGSHLASAGSVWVEPDLDDLVAALRETVADPAAARARADRARIRIAAETRPERTAAALEQIALDTLLRPPPPPLRLAWITSWRVRCGVAEYAGHLLDHLPPDGLADMVVLADERSLPCAEGVRVRPIWRRGELETVPPLMQAIAEEDPHAVVLQHQPGLLGWGMLATLLSQLGLTDRPTVLMLHNTADLLDRPEPEQAAMRRAMPLCARILVHTVADLNRLAALGSVDNVALLPHGAPPARPPRPARRLGPADPVLIGSYGFFLPGKGLPELVGALAILRQRWPGARLRLVNAHYGERESDDEIATCRRLAEAAGLAAAVEFHTDFLPHDASLDLLAACDLVVLPYQRSKEASSASLRTALAAGAPVAVTDLPIFAEADAAVARLPGTDAPALAAGIARLLDDPSARDALTASATPWMQERAWPIVGARLAGMIRGLVP